MSVEIKSLKIGNESDSISSITNKYKNIYIIIGPPRTGSTAFGRVFWGHPEIKYYSHEPFEINYFNNAEVEDSLNKIENPTLDIEEFNLEKSGDSLVIKEMTYQVNQHFPLLASITKVPIIFLLRDPRLSIKSRMDKKAESGVDPLFPQVETGWDYLKADIAHCEENDIPFIIVDAKDWRSRPEEIFSKVFDKIGLEYSSELLSWKPRPEVGSRFDNLDGTNAYVGSHLYARVLESKGILPDDSPLPALEDFSEEKNYRNHVKSCLDIYKELQNHPNKI